MAAASVRAAIVGLLEADAAITSLSTGVHHQVAPAGSARPYVIVLKSAGAAAWAMQGSPVKRESWTVKAVGPDSDTLESIDARFDAALTDADLDVTGRATMWLRRDSDISYPETVDGEIIRHLGGLYRLYTDG